MKELIAALSTRLKSPPVPRRNVNSSEPTATVSISSITSSKSPNANSLNMAISVSQLLQQDARLSQLMLQLETTPSAAGTTSSSLESTTRLANEILSLFQAHFNIQAGKAPGGSGWGGTTAATTTSGSSSSNYNIQHLLLNHSDSSSSKVTVFLYFLSRLCPGLLPPARIFRDYWEPLLKPILISSRNMELLHLTSHIVKNSFVQDSISITIADEEAMHLELMLADYISLVMERDQQRHDRLLLNLSPETGAASSGLSANVIARLDTFESILVTIGFAIPKHFFQALSSILNKENSAAHHLRQLHAASLLLGFLKHDDAPIFYVCETRLFQDLVECSLKATMASLLYTLITSITIIIPFILIKLSPTDIDSLLQLLNRSVLWNISFTRIMVHVCKTISCGGASESFNNSSFEPHLSSFSSPSPSHDQDRPMDNNKTVGEVVDDGLFGLDRVAALLCESTPSTFSHAILNLYSVLYGISPLRSTAALKSAILSSSTTDTAKTPAALTLVIDLTPFISAGFPQQALEECLEDIDSSVIIEAYMNLLRTHRVTTELILSDVAKETVNFTQKFKDLTPSDILICCLELRAKRERPSLLDHLPNSISSRIASPPDSSTWDLTLDKLVDTVFSLSRTLRGEGYYVKEPSVSLSSSASSINQEPYQQSGRALLLSSNLFLTILKNESVYEYCIRQRYEERVRVLKKQIMSISVQLGDQQMVYETLRLQKQKNNLLVTSIDKQKAETALVRDSSRKYEDDLSKRFRATKESLKLVSDERDALKAALDSQTAEMRDRVDMMETSRARIFELENEIKLLARDVSRLHEYEDMIQTLSRKIMDLEAVVRVEEEEVGRRKPSGIAMDDHSDEASGHGLAVTKRLELLEEENSILQKSVSFRDQEIQALKDMIEGLERKAAQDQATIKQQVSINERLRQVHQEQTKYGEEKYQTIRKINYLLESRLLDNVLANEQ